jgi:hypothetical protein
MRGKRNGTSSVQNVPFANLPCVCLWKPHVFPQKR